MRVPGPRAARRSGRRLCGARDTRGAASAAGAQLLRQLKGGGGGGGRTKLLARLKEPASRELERLRKLKEEEKKERGEPFDGKINSWDFNYYHTLLKQVCPGQNFVIRFAVLVSAGFVPR